MATPESMEQQGKIHKISVTWRGKKFFLEINSGAILKELGDELQKLTDVKADTMRLIVPSYKSSILLSPFSDEHCCLSLEEVSLLEGKSIRMMGVPKDEVDALLQNAKTDLRIAGFDEEEKRQRQRTLGASCASVKLPQGTYIFCDFRTLHLPGIELNPPAFEALKLMHMLAADPGIVAIMNKHRWRVGIMTEMAPVGYVGVSPKCILGFNKNHGEEISLRLRTDDLKGFRKYESIKKTLLHELAHMTYSEHDANFYALDKQLNQEAATLDWTRSTSHTLTGVRHQQYNEEKFCNDNSSVLSQKLGGKVADQLANARASSVAAAYRRLVSRGAEADHEPDPDDARFDPSDYAGVVRERELNLPDIQQVQGKLNAEPDPDDCHASLHKLEPDPDDSTSGEPMEFETYAKSSERRNMLEPDPDDLEMAQCIPSIIDQESANMKACKELDPNDLTASCKNGLVVEPNQFKVMKNLDSQIQLHMICQEPDPDDSGVLKNTRHGDLMGLELNSPDDSRANENMLTEPDPDDIVVPQQRISEAQIDEPDSDDQEIQRIQDPVALVCDRLQKAIEMLRSEVNPSEAATVLQTLFKIIQNVIEHPNEMKFKRLRKANPVIQRNVVNYKAAMEILTLVGFIEDAILDEIGKVETYLVLKRNDPGLLWLAKSSLETCIAF